MQGRLFLFCASLDSLSLAQTVSKRICLPVCLSVCLPCLVICLIVHQCAAATAYGDSVGGRQPHQMAEVAHQNQLQLS